MKLLALFLCAVFLFGCAAPAEESSVSSAAPPASQSFSSSEVPDPPEPSVLTFDGDALLREAEEIVIPPHGDHEGLRVFTFDEQNLILRCTPDISEAMHWEYIFYRMGDPTWQEFEGDFYPANFVSSDYVDFPGPRTYFNYAYWKDGSVYLSTVLLDAENLTISHHNNYDFKPMTTYSILDDTHFVMFAWRSITDGDGTVLESTREVWIYDTETNTCEQILCLLFDEVTREGKFIYTLSLEDGNISLFGFEYAEDGGQNHALYTYGMDGRELAVTPCPEITEVLRKPDLLKEGEDYYQSVMMMSRFGDYLYFLTLESETYLFKKGEDGFTLIKWPSWIASGENDKQVTVLTPHRPGDEGGVPLYFWNRKQSEIYILNPETDTFHVLKFPSLEGEAANRHYLFNVDQNGNLILNIFTPEDPEDPENMNSPYTTQFFYLTREQILSHVGIPVS